MLERTEISHPCGIDEWDIIASTSIPTSVTVKTEVGMIKNEFKALKNVRKWTGYPNIPLDVRRAKLKEIEERMCNQTLGGDDSNNDNESAASVKELLTTTSVKLNSLTIIVVMMSHMVAAQMIQCAHSISMMMR